MDETFYFYDLETSGFNPREARIMQFAGQRTNMQLEPIGEPHNIVIKLSPDVVPDPDAVLITGITPQQTIAEGVTEAEFLAVFHAQIATPGTVFVGYNTVRFDDEFMRFLQYRNFYDPYEWQYKDNKSRWDLLDVVRMTRALRPDGITWPFAPDGKPANRLELLTSVNNLEHSNAHDALSDVRATIALAKLLRTKQPKLFDYLLSIRKKQSVARLVEGGSPFIYSSGKYSSEWEKTTAVATVTMHEQGNAALVFDLRFDPLLYAGKTATELAELWKYNPDPDAERLPVKTLKYNRCPAIAPLSVFDEASQKRLKLTTKTIEKHFANLQKAELAKPLLEAIAILESQKQTTLVENIQNVDARLYDKFIPDVDKKTMALVQKASADTVETLEPRFSDARLSALFPLYKARNFPTVLSSTEQAAWQDFVRKKLIDGGMQSRLAKYFARIEELSASENLTNEKRYLLEELQLYGQSIVPDELL